MAAYDWRILMVDPIKTDDLSVKDKILVVPMCLTGLLAMGLSFGLQVSIYRQRFFICLVVFSLCVIMADRRWTLLLCFLCFFAIRALWAVTLILAHRL